MHTATHPPVPPVPPVPVLTGLGQALRWLRERQARKQYQVATAAGITKGMLSAYETGRQRPSLETLDKLLDTLGCDLNDLHNALQIVNGRPDQMKGWRAAAETPGAWLERPDGPAGGTAPSWPSWPSSPSWPSWPTARASEVHEPTGGREGLGLPALPALPAVSALHQVLGLPAPVESIDSFDALDSLEIPPDSQAAGPDPPLPPEEEMALAQMLEGFHNLLRYWHRCLSLLAAARAAVPANLPSTGRQKSGGEEKGGHEKRAGQEKMGDQRKRP